MADALERAAVVGGDGVDAFKQGTVDNVTTSSSAAASSAVDAAACIVSVDVDHYVLQNYDGESTDATSSNGAYFPAGTFRAYKCNPGTTKFSAITKGGGAGVMSIEPLI